MVNKYKVYRHSSLYPQSWTFEGSTDNSNWVVLDTKYENANLGPITSGVSDDALINGQNTAYQYFRFKFTSTSDTTSSYSVKVREIQFYTTDEIVKVWSDKSVESDINSVASDASGSYWEGQRFVNKDGFFTPDGGPAHLTTPDGYYLVSAHANFEGSTQNSTAALGLRLTGETEDDVWKKQRYSQAYGTGTSDQEFFLSISRVLNLSTTRGVAFTADNSQVNMQKINFTITPV